jgi:hypothetical protein
MTERIVILKPRDEAKDLPKDDANHSRCGRRETECRPIRSCPDHFAECILKYVPEHRTLKSLDRVPLCVSYLPLFGESGMMAGLAGRGSAW